MLFWKVRSLPNLVDEDKRKEYFKKVYYSLPVFDNNFFQLYVNRVKADEIPNGTNHNDDHQAARHGTYSFLMSILDKRNNRIDEALSSHMARKYGIVRGFKVKSLEDVEFNLKNTSGDQLLGICLGILPYALNQTTDTDLNNPRNQTLTERFEQIVNDIIDNDYALRDEDLSKKADRGMWQPGLETVGAQSITILATLKLAERLGSPTAKTHYNKLSRYYGYSLLSFFPTTFFPTQRGYFNDHNCLVAAYILTKLSKGFSKYFWGSVMLYVWSLSYKWYNGYFTGLVNDALPGVISKNYLETCKKYIYEMEPKTISQDKGTHRKAQVYPVAFNMMNQGEFHPDEDHKIVLNHEKEHLSGLGWLAHAIMIDPEESKRFLK